jgi:hypothetical protein
VKSPPGGRSSFPWEYSTSSQTGRATSPCLLVAGRTLFYSQRASREDQPVIAIVAHWTCAALPSGWISLLTVPLAALSSSKPLVDVGGTVLVSCYTATPWPQFGLRLSRLSLQRCGVRDGGDWADGVSLYRSMRTHPISSQTTSHYNITNSMATRFVCSNCRRTKKRCDKALPSCTLCVK